jgi:hypothetical protein
MEIEKQVIDDLGNWLCRDMEKEIQFGNLEQGLLSTYQMEKQKMIREVSKRIKFYRDNVLLTRGE